MRMTRCPAEADCTLRCVRLPARGWAVVYLLLAAAAAAAAAPAAPPEVLKLDGDVERVHDPVLIREKDTYYVFSTGGGRGTPGVIPIRSSTDLHTWKRAGSVFEQLPEWTTREIPKAMGAWAPDISYYNGRFHLYYSVSTFGSRNSAIGLATNVTLDPSSPEYKWVDEGMVLRSYQEKDDWNAIDPNLAIVNKKDAWLNWGSFWGGIKMRRIDPKTGKLSAKDTTMYSLASRPREQPVGGSIEAPFIVKRGDYWYLFVSFDRCCRGVKSTYNIVVGRSKRVTGPYVDREGLLMTDGGGSLLLEAATRNWRGPGHQAVFRDRGTDYLVLHAYHGTTGRPHLQISTMVWQDGWPRAGSLP